MKELCMRPPPLAVHRFKTRLHLQPPFHYEGDAHAIVESETGSGRGPKGFSGAPGPHCACLSGQSTGIFRGDDSKKMGGAAKPPRTRPRAHREAFAVACLSPF